MAQKSAISEIRGRLDAERRRFAVLASDIESDEPTRFFLIRTLDSFERLDLDLRNLDYASQNSDSGEVS